MNVKSFDFLDYIYIWELYVQISGPYFSIGHFLKQLLCFELFNVFWVLILYQMSVWQTFYPSL